MTAPAPFLRTETILDRILSHKMAELTERQAKLPLAQIRAEAEAAAPTRAFEDGLKATDNIAIIAECKRASPSAGIISENFDPVDLALRYEAYGAAAVSVLTDTKFFGGSLEDLRAVRRAVTLPLLRKDFLFDPYQLYEARAAGADAILLIVAALEEEALRDLLAEAREFSLAALVEVHDEMELERALRCGASLIGINNRDLRTFQTDLRTTMVLAPLIPSEIALVAESGIRSAADVSMMAAAGAQAVLVGESLVRTADLRETLGAFASVPRQ